MFHYMNFVFELHSFILCLWLYQAGCTTADVMYRSRLELGGRAREHGQCLRQVSRPQCHRGAAAGMEAKVVQLLWVHEASK